MGFTGFEAGGADGSGADGLEGSDRDFLSQAEDSCVCWMFPRVAVVCAFLYCPPSFWTCKMDGLTRNTFKVGGVRSRCCSRALQ